MPESFENEIAVLERGLKALHVEYERFYIGEVKVPPVDTRRRIEDLLKRMAGANVERAAERFRLQNVQSRFQSMTELWEKRLLAREEGRPGLGRPPRWSPAAPAGTRSDAEASMSVTRRERKSLMPLFERFCEARRALGEDVSRLRYDRFEELLRRQAAEIRKATGAKRLVFEVQTVDGRVRLIGRPAHPKGSS